MRTGTEGGDVGRDSVLLGEFGARSPQHNTAVPEREPLHAAAIDNDAHAAKNIPQHLPRRSER
jgi:hypothetical protein